MVELGSGIEEGPVPLTCLRVIGSAVVMLAIRPCLGAQNVTTQINEATDFSAASLTGSYF